MSIRQPTGRSDLLRAAMDRIAPPRMSTPTGLSSLNIAPAQGVRSAPISSFGHRSMSGTMPYQNVLSRTLSGGGGISQYSGRSPMGIGPGGGMYGGRPLGINTLGTSGSFASGPLGGFTSGLSGGFGIKTASMGNLGSRLAPRMARLSMQKELENQSLWGSFGGDVEVIFNGGQGLEGTRQWESEIQRVSRESGVPAKVLRAIMGIESGGVNHGANKAGATGLMQVVPRWWQSTADKYGGNLMDPYTNIRTAADILQSGYDQYGSWENAAAFYFGGGGAFAEGGGYSNAADYFGTDIRTYVSKFGQNMRAQEERPLTTGAGVQVSGGGKVFPVKGYTGGLSLHHGSHPGAIDIFADYGTPILAITGGIATSGVNGIGGYWTMIQGDDGLKYYYAHMDKMGPNGRVETGSYIAGVSDTGNAKGTGAHLHLGIGTTIYSGTGPQGGAGDINVIDFLNGTTRY